MLSRVFFAGERFRDGELLEDSLSSAGVSTSLGETGPFPLSRGAAHRDRYLARLFQDRNFCQFGPVTSHSHTVSARPDFATPSSVLFVPLSFSPCPDVNRRIDLLVIGSSECSSSRLPRRIRGRMGDQQSSR